MSTLQPLNGMVRRYGPVVLAVVGAVAISIPLRGFAYPRPLVLLALVLSIWGRGLGPGFLGAGLSTVMLRIVFPDLEPTYGIISDAALFAVAAVTVSTYSGAKVRAETALRESEGRLALALRAAQLGVWDCSLRKDEVGLSPKYKEVYKRDPLTRADWLTLVHPDDRERVVAAARSSFGGTRQWDEEFRVLMPDGGIRWMHSYGTVLVDATDQPVSMVGVSQDVTEQKLMAIRLRDQTVQLLEAQRLARIGSWERHLDIDKSHWSDELRRILGVTEGEREGFTTFINCIHPEDREKVRDTERRARSARGPVEAKYRVLRPDGETRFIRSIVLGIRNDQDAVIRLVGVAQDVTEQVQAQEHLTESEEHLKNAERLAQVGHWHWDIPADRVSGSEEMYRIFGKRDDYTPDYEGFMRVLVPQDREKVERAIRESLVNKTGCSIEYQIVHADGDLRTISCIWEVLLDENGSPVRMFGACQDVTEVRRSQEESFAKQKLETVGTLAGGIAHDFNNLLGGVLAQAELALAELRENLSNEEALNGIRDAALRGAEIVRQLMTYAGQESETIGLVDVSRVVQEMLALLRVSVSKHAVLKAEPGEFPAVRAGAAQIRQIVLNLVMNASDAIGDRDGVIHVTTRHVGTPEGDYLQLEVSDTGCGMSRETQARVFEPFFTTKSAGHGLGLAVVQGIVRRLGGVIQITSEPGKGTTFQVLLPCAEPGAGVSADPSSRTDEPARPLPETTVLIVEDEAPLREAVAKTLRKTGYVVMEASDGSTALEMIREHPGTIAVLLLDLTLPGAPSRQIFDEAQRLRPEMKVMVTSAYGAALATTTLQRTVDCFVRKPYRLAELVELIRQNCS